MTNIVVGIDGSEMASQAAVWAAHEAELHGWQLTAVMAWGLLDQHHANASDPFDPHYDEHAALAALDEYLKGALGSSSAMSVQRRAVVDLPARALVEASNEASMLVVGARGLGGFRAMLLGSVSEQCLRHATCPVAIVRRGRSTGGSPGRVVVGIDGSATATEALRWAVHEARLREVALQVVHAWDVPFVGEYLLEQAPFEDAARSTLDAAIESVDTTGLVEPPQRTLSTLGAAEAILSAAEGADLVVMGSRGVGGFKGLLLGSVSHQIAHHASCAVVIVPREGSRIADAEGQAPGSA